jgi:hypothetical protein
MALKMYMVRAWRQIYLHRTPLVPPLWHMPIPPQTKEKLIKLTQWTKLFSSKIACSQTFTYRIRGKGSCVLAWSWIAGVVWCWRPKELHPVSWGKRLVETEYLPTARVNNDHETMIKLNREAVMSMLHQTTDKIHFNIPFNKRATRPLFCITYKTHINWLLGIHTTAGHKRRSHSVWPQ